MYRVYAIYNKKNNKIYIGQTKNLDERLKSHNNRTFERSYTARFDGNWKIIYTENCSDRASAIKREGQLKSYQGRLFVRKFIPQ